MGSIAWKGEPLRSGYRCSIGGKEVELDCQVSASDLPTVAGLVDGDKPVKSEAVISRAPAAAASPAPEKKEPHQQMAPLIPVLSAADLAPPRLPTRQEMENVLLDLRKKALMEEYLGS